ncbi:LacI family DNA-binding transcriptional regulator [Faecalibacterium prausnitzii]|jgi:LacI family transcriptional regulator|uniref:LacI family DNA-binding transcriptional regulator n=1 Tax=Faecalibacterium prausnitzii TaxID=853 RepID=UPI0032B4EDB6
MATKVTIQDIASELQLSRNTVSKAINNTGVLADATREKILRKAAEMGYKQFAYLPLFQEGAAKTAGLSILPSDKREIAMLTTQFLSSSHFSSMMLDRFQSEIDHLHSGMTIHRISPIELKEKKLPSSLDIQRTAGIICFEVFDYDYAQMLCDLDVPLLFVDTPVMDMRPPLKADRLYMENRIEIQNAVAHMVQRGKKRISFAGDKNHCQSFFERYMAYKDAMEYFGLTEGLSTCAMPSGQQNYPVSLYETIRRFKTMPDAFVCANDFVAMDLVKALNELGYSVPDDIWVCGFDDSQEASYFSPHLTSIHIHEQIMGYTAANLLMTRIEEPSLNYRTVYTETNLILRESTGD